MYEKLKKYKKIYIIGACGSGKTTFAQKLAKYLDYPNFTLDNVYRYKETRAICSEKERTKILNSILNQETWIIEGAQCHDWIESIWKNCDIVILCNPSALTRIFYISKRYILNLIRGKHTDFLVDIFATIKFKRNSLPKFQEYVKKHRKEIIKLFK